MRIAPHALLDRRASRCDARCVTMHAPCTPLARSDWLRQALSFARTTSPGLLLQVEYYFSEGNFAKDKFMQAETAKTKEQWVNIRADTYAPGPFAGLFRTSLLRAVRAAAQGGLPASPHTAARAPYACQPRACRVPSVPRIACPPQVNISVMATFNRMKARICMYVCMYGWMDE